MPVNQMNGVHLDLADSGHSDAIRHRKGSTRTTSRAFMPFPARLNKSQRISSKVCATASCRQSICSRELLPRPADIGQKATRRQPLHEAIAKRFSSAIPEQDRQRLTQSIEAAVRDEVEPAYAKFAAFVRNQYAPHGGTEYGVWALPDGAAQYRFAVRHMTTTGLTPDQIHRWDSNRWRLSKRRCCRWHSRLDFRT